MEILVVDDYKDLAELIGQALREKGYKVSVFGDPFDVLSFEDLSRFHLIISDYNMPGMSGIKLIQKVREKNLTIKSVILTSNFGTIPKSERTSEFIDAFIEKGDECWKAIESFIKSMPLPN